MRYFRIWRRREIPMLRVTSMSGKGLRRSDLDRDPIKQFGNWFTAAIEASIRDVNAMSLATAGANGRPSVRIVLLKGFDHDGFVFFTNYESEKESSSMPTPYAALAFYWIELDRQIRISGRRKRLRAKNRKPIFIRVRWAVSCSAWASRQSQVVDGRRVLDARMAQMTERFGDKRIPLPPHWGGVSSETGYNRILAGAERTACTIGFVTLASPMAIG